MSQQASALPSARAEFEAQYVSALREYLRNGGEKELRCAYEVGRQALARDIGVLEAAAMHHGALAQISAGARGPGLDEKTLKMGGQFLMEVLSAYEMRQRAHREAVDTLRRLNDLLEKEVKRIAHAVHDEAGQLLVAAHLAIAEVMRESNPRTREQLMTVNQMLDEVSNHLRHLSHEIYPTMLDELGLVSAIGFLADSLSKRSQIPIRVQSTLRARLPAPIENCLYRVIQEALANVTKHAGAHHVNIEIGKKQGQVVCSVQDDGVGFDPSTLQQRDGRKNGLGLTGIRERLNGVGGVFQVRSRPGHGSKLQFKVPLEE